MSAATRERLVRLVRHADPDLGEAALLCCAEADPDVDIEAALLRIDALADGLRSRGFQPRSPLRDAERIGDYLARDLGITGDRETYYHPDNALLTRVLDRRRGLPITCSMLYCAIARRLGVGSYLITLPGHVVVGLPGPERPVVIDPFHGGRLLDEADLSRRLTETTAGQVTYRRAMLRPAPAVDVVRRLLNNLTRDYTAIGDVQNALWTVELKLLLPNRAPDDHRVHGELLEHLGSFDRSAAAFEEYLEVTGGTATDDGEVRQAAIRARARLN